MLDVVTMVGMFGDTAGMGDIWFVIVGLLDADIGTAGRSGIMSCDVGVSGIGFVCGMGGICV